MPENDSVCTQRPYSIETWSPTKPALRLISLSLKTENVTPCAQYLHLLTLDNGKSHLSADKECHLSILGKVSYHQACVLCIVRVLSNYSPP